MGSVPRRNPIVVPVEEDLMEFVPPPPKPVVVPGPQAFVFHYRKDMPSEEDMEAMTIPEFLRRD